MENTRGLIDVREEEMQRDQTMDNEVTEKVRSFADQRAKLGALVEALLRHKNGAIGMIKLRYLCERTSPILSHRCFVKF